VRTAPDTRFENWIVEMRDVWNVATSGAEDRVIESPWPDNGNINVNPCHRNLPYPSAGEGGSDMGANPLER
jgi:hypothetical protein